MTATTPFATLFGGSERSALDLPVACLAGLAVAFAAFTIPNEVLADAVGATGIGSVFAAAQPPLGSTARLAIAVAGALVAFASAFVLLRWLDRFASRPAASRQAPAGEGPRIRKSDAHPDAPAPRPISASRDLGEPAPPSLPAETRSAEPAPSEPWPLAIQAKPEPVERAAPALAPEPVIASAVERPVSVEPVRNEPQSLGALMARLEQGLARREGREDVAAAEPREVAVESPAASTQAVDPAPPADTVSERQATPVARTDRLQSAIEGLRALSAG